VIKVSTPIPSVLLDSSQKTILFATALGGSFIGRKMVDKIDQQVFRKIVLVSIILVSINFIVDGIKS
jgi:uncharacterized membrane protein YfcA